MKIKIAWVGKTREPAIQTLTAEYLKRISRYADAEGLAVRAEAGLLELSGANLQAKSKSKPSLRKSSLGKSTLVLLDVRGKQFSSEEWAGFLGNYKERNPLPLVFAIGPADGFSETARGAAQHMLSLGRITLAHELARIVLLEQVYRAFTILHGHPYHSGH